MAILYQGPILRLSGKKWEKAWIILNFEINFLHMSIFKDKHVRREVEKRFNFTTHGENVRFGSTTLNIPNVPKIENDIRVHPYCYMAIETEKFVKKKTVKKVSWLSFFSVNDMFKFIRACTLALNYINIPAPTSKCQDDSFALHNYKPEPYRVRNNWDRFYDNPPSFSTNSFTNKSISLDALHAMTQYEDYQNRTRIRSNSESNLKKLEYENETDEASSITYQPMYVKASQCSGVSVTPLQRRKEFDESSLIFENSLKSHGRPKSQIYEKIIRRPIESTPDQTPARRIINESYEKKRPDSYPSRRAKVSNSFDSNNSCVYEPMDAPPEVISVIYGNDEVLKKYSPIGLDLNPILYKRIDKEDIYTSYNDSTKTFNRKNSMKKNNTQQLYRNHEKSHLHMNGEPILTAIYKDCNESERIPIEESDGKYYAIPIFKQPESVSQNVITELEERIKENKKFDSYESSKQEDSVVTRTRKSSLHSIQIEDENGKQEIMKEESSVEIRYD
uniref:PH domain-containing protein n=1 Tax=Strongyloides stercoralis TaxID=6248 RepID=A0AAF5CQF1_STRER